jgi:hypothetical protein
MSRHTTRKEDWTRFLNALLGIGNEDRHSNPILNYILSIGHTGKNIIVEERRRW